MLDFIGLAHYTKAQYTTKCEQKMISLTSVRYFYFYFYGYHSRQPMAALK